MPCLEGAPDRGGEGKGRLSGRLRLSGHLSGILFDLKGCLSGSAVESLSPDRVARGLPIGGQGSKVYVLCAERKEHKKFCPGTGWDDR